MNNSTLERYNDLDIHAKIEDIKSRINRSLRIKDHQYISDKMLYLSNDRIERIDQNSENGFIFIWDSMIRHPIELIFERFKLNYNVARNVTESSHLTRDQNAKLRPDFMILIDGNNDFEKLLVFKGEEKALSSKLNEAKIELVGKLSNRNIKETSVFYPLLFCYAAAGKNVQFFVIERNNKNKINEMTDILDLTDSNDRTKIITIVTNMALIIVKWYKDLYQLI